MSLDAIIRRVDRQPLGSIEEVQQKLIDAFPGIQFGIEHGRGDQGQGAAIAALLSLISIKVAKVEYPYHEAYFQRGQFAAQFNLGSGPTVRDIQVTLYGRGTSEATPHFDKLTRETGWQLEY
jgi:hypothetical protein